MKKKIIFVTKALWIGGIETALVNLLKHFDYEQYDVTLLVTRAELAMLGQIHPNCRVLIVDRESTISFTSSYRYSKLFHLTEPAASPSRLHRAMMWAVPAIKWIENRLYIRYIRKLMKGEQFDTAIIYSDVVAETAVRAIHADKFLMFYHHGAMRHVYHDKIAYKVCDKIIAVSQNQAEQLRRFVPQYVEKVVVIHNLTDVDGIRAKAQLPCGDVFDETKFNIVSVGRVSHEKGMDIAVRACAKLVRDGFTDVQWWIIGDGPAMQEVRDVVAECHVEGYVCLVGMKDNPYPYMKQADLYVQPSRFEGYPMTILEALVLGQPVISTDNNGAREILENEKTGILCKTDSDAVAEIITRFLINREIYHKFEKNVESLDFERKNREIVSQIKKFV